MGVQPVLLFLSFSSFVLSIHAQVIIKERVSIHPGPQIIRQSSASTLGPLLRLRGNILETTMPGVVVSAGVSTSPFAIPENTAFEVWASVGGSSQLMRRMGTGYCVGSGNKESGPISVTLQRCGVIGLSAKTFVPAPWQWSCAPMGTAIDTPIVAGNSATITARGSLWYTGFTATLSITASLDESYLLSQIVAVPETSALTCNAVTGVGVTVLDAHGDLYTDCSGSQLRGTATIKAKGKYALLQGDGDPGTSVNFTIAHGRGAFFVVLDTSKGIIEGGSDVAQISVQVGGITGSTSVAMSCDYPPPTVAITYPGSDTTITLSPDNLPSIVFQEIHTPGPGKPFEPSIGWTPGPVLTTGEYYGKIQDSLVIPVKATATNAGGSAIDELKIILKRGCNLSPPHYRQQDTLWAKETYDSTKSTINALGCALSSMAMVMTAFGDTVDPGALNKWMKARNGDNGGFYGNLVNWNAISKHSASRISFSYYKNGKLPDTAHVARLTDLANDLDRCSLIIAQVFNRMTGNQHWIVLTGRAGGKYSIVDPGRGETYLDGYANKVWSYVVVARN